MSIAIQDEDKDCKSGAADQVIKKYKKVIFLTFVVANHEKQLLIKMRDLHTRVSRYILC